MDCTLDVVLPCLDEAAALEWVLSRMPVGARPIVVDNGSTDGSADVAVGLGATVVSEWRRGYGAACHAGLEAATAPLVAVMDCDATLDPQELERFVAAVASDDVPTLAVGRRVPVSAASWPWHLRVANRVVAGRVNRRTGLSLADIGPMRVAPREALLALGLEDRRSGYPVETVVRAAEAGWLVVQVDVPYAARSGRSKVTGTPLGAARAVRDMTAVLSR
ncbi:MAG TPA: glycosyltransferase family 2 protein [Lapillicoccus sp.]|jgi:glycosyltransferase involved in cell wall biosynthesis|uniref:glycosyltransferase family 2 protein n=1 Tax=Lapillicoccus sp. TaxID=1909287 RepID=UPI002F945BC9